jgi:hypothetical protein
MNNGRSTKQIGLHATTTRRHFYQKIIWTTVIKINNTC